MREIRFRVWSGKEMRYPALYWFEENDVWQWPADAPEGYALMQYTGLTDGNGKPIFEGDIIADWDGTDPAVIVWDDGSAAFAYKPIESDDPDADGGLLYELYLSQRRIVGNKFEHPELLQTKENDLDEHE